MQELESAGALPIEAAARRLALSTRSLQRTLREAGTTYRLELKAFRIRRAQELLRGDHNLGTIAAEVGFSSAGAGALGSAALLGEGMTWREVRRAVSDQQSAEAMSPAAPTSNSPPDGPDQDDESRSRAQAR